MLFSRLIKSYINIYKNIVLEINSDSYGASHHTTSYLKIKKKIQIKTLDREV